MTFRRSGARDARRYLDQHRGHLTSVLRRDDYVPVWELKQHGGFARRVNHSPHLYSVPPSFDHDGTLRPPSLLSREDSPMTIPRPTLPSTPPTTPEVRPHQLVVLVYGTPAPQGSKRHVGNGVMVESNQHSLRTWREDVKLAALRALEETPGWERDYAQVAAHIVFTLPRPKGHFRSGKFAHLLRDNAPRLHGTKPDLDKLLRSTWDALGTAGAYADDSRIAQVYSVKTYPSIARTVPGALDQPGARIVLTGVGRR